MSEIMNGDLSQRWRELVNRALTMIATGQTDSGWYRAISDVDAYMFETERRLTAERDRLAEALTKAESEVSRLRALATDLSFGDQSLIYPGDWRCYECEQLREDGHVPDCHIGRSVEGTS